MAARSLAAVSLATILAFTVPGTASAGELRLIIGNGRVTLTARDVPLREILVEWERVGGTHVVNRDAVSGAPISLDLVDVTEAHALATLLRSAAGYLAFARTAPADAASRFTRIVIMPGAEKLADGPQLAAGSQPSGAAVATGLERPQIQQRIMPGGRVISVMEYPARRVETPTAVEEEPVQPPPIEDPAGLAVPVAPGMGPISAPPNPSQGALPTQASPTVPETAAKPGARTPAPKAGAAPYTPQGPPPPPVPPIKPPGVA